MAKTLVYQMYPLAWRGLPEMTSHLERVSALGADYVWLSPVYPSPFNDGGYDISDYKAINATFGTEEDMREFIARAHSRGIGVLMDLVLNHTSVKHPWFRSHPEYYCWTLPAHPLDIDTPPHPGWHNLFNNGPAWAYDEDTGLYYLHLFHESQADLNWFPQGRLNQALVEEFQSIIEFWRDFGVDGFRLDIPQSINKGDLSRETLELADILSGHQAAGVISAVFAGHEDLFIMMECLDPTMGSLVEYYTTHTPIDFAINIALKDEITGGDQYFQELISRHCQNQKFMLELESHDAPRFPSRRIVFENEDSPKEVTPEDAIWYMFSSEAEGICLYQGQELGLRNPTKSELPDGQMMRLDVQTAMRCIKGEELDDLRPLSRANTRVPISINEYARQEESPSSYLHLTRTWIQRWRESVA